MLCKQQWVFGKEDVSYWHSILGFVKECIKLQFLCFILDGSNKNLHSLVVSTDICNQLTMTNSTTWKNFNPYFPGTSFSWVSGDTCIAVVVDSGSSRL